MRGKIIIILILIFIWIMLIPVAFFEGKINPGVEYYTACFIETFCFSMGLFVGWRIKKHETKKTSV